MTSAYVWVTRCIPAFSCVAVAALLVLSFVVWPYGKGDKGEHRGDATIPQSILGAYTVFLHLLSVAFTARVCYAMGNVLKKTKESSSIEDNPQHRSMQLIKTKDGELAFPAPLFIIILPAYKEDLETLEETIRVLASHPQASYCYHVYLAMEDREEKAALKAGGLVASFGSHFYKMSFTIHPSGIAGEAQGKSSNESWAAKQAFKDYPSALKSSIIMTVMDADTHLSPRYFAQIAQSHLNHPETNATTIYVPPLVFDRNLHHVPLPVRTADLMWAGAGISSLYPSSGVVIPTSVYSLPMTLVERVGGWDTDPGAIGEDMHMYLKCFFALGGNLNAQIVYASASQCDVSSDVKGLSGYIDGLNARYKQALRHMWGSLDTGYTVRQTAEMMRRQCEANHPVMELPLSAQNSNWTAFYTSTGLQKSLIPRLPDTMAPAPKPICWINVLTLYHRIFEAHFLPIHLCVILSISALYGLLTPSFLVPRSLRIALEMSGWCRLVGFILMLLFFHRYSKYHQLCLELRQEEMRRAGLLADMMENDGFTKSIFQIAGLAETAVFPLGGFVFGAIPALQAVLSHLFTDRLTYVVSLKPQLAMKRWRAMAPSSVPLPLPKPRFTASLKHLFFTRLEHVAASWRWTRPVVERND